MCFDKRADTLIRPYKETTSVYNQMQRIFRTMSLLRQIFYQDFPTILCPYILLSPFVSLQALEWRRWMRNFAPGFENPRFVTHYLLIKERERA